MSECDRKAEVLKIFNSGYEDGNEFSSTYEFTLDEVSKIQNVLLITEGSGSVFHDIGLNDPYLPMPAHDDDLQSLREVATRKEKECRAFANEHKDHVRASSNYHGLANAYEVMKGLIEEKICDRALIQPPSKEIQEDMRSIDARQLAESLSNVEVEE